MVCFMCFGQMTLQCNVYGSHFFLGHPYIESGIALSDYMNDY